jgi:hypothetical protein
MSPKSGNEPAARLEQLGRAGRSASGPLSISRATTRPKVPARKGGVSALDATYRTRLDRRARRSIETAASMPTTS